MEKSETLNILMKGAGIVAIGMVISKFMTYFYRVIVARFIGPDAYGQLALGLTVLSIAGTISLIGLDQAINRFVAKYNAQEDYAALKGVVLSSIKLTLPLSILAGFTVYFGAGFIANSLFESPELVPILKLFAFLVPFANLGSIGTATLTAFKEMKYRVLINQISQPVIQLIATVILVWQGYGVMGAAAGWFIGAVAATGLRLYYVEKIGPVLTRKVNPDYRYREVARFSAPLMFAAIIGTVLGWVDTMFLGYFMDDAHVGFYNAAFPTALLILLPYQALNSLALPSMSEIRETGETSLTVVVKNLSRWTLLASFPAFLLMMLFSEQVMHLMFGAEYTVAATALIILAGANLFNAATGHLSEVIKSIDRTDLLLKNTVGNLVVNVTLNAMLIPIYGINGAAVATLSSIVVVNSLLLLETFYLERITPFHRSMWKPIAASVAPLIATYAGLKLAFNTVPVWVLVPGGLVFGTLYTLNLILIGGVEERDRSLIVGFARKTGREELGEKIADLLIR